MSATQENNKEANICFLTRTWSKTTIYALVLSRESKNSIERLPHTTQLWKYPHQSRKKNRYSCELTPHRAQHLPISTKKNKTKTFKFQVHKGGDLVPHIQYSTFTVLARGPTSCITGLEEWQEYIIRGFPSSTMNKRMFWSPVA